MLNKRFQRLTQILAVLSFIFIFTASNSIQAQPFNLIVQKSNLKLLIKDKQTGRRLANKTVKIYSDNGIRCIQAPCPTNGKSWTGKTDKQGFVIIPNDMRQRSMSLDIKGYSGEELTRAARKLSENSWVIALKTR